MTMSTETQFDASPEYTSTATLIITGSDLDPSHITQLMGLPPNKVWRKGEKKIFKSGEEFSYPWGGWKLFQPPDKNDAPLEVQLEYWATVLENKSAELGQISALQHSINLDCFIEVQASATSQLSPDLLARLQVLCIGITLNIFRGD